MPPIPRVILAYGILGLIPFLAPPAIGAAVPRYAPLAAQALAAYAALILSFLGGARWAFAATRPAPITITLSMLPCIAGLVLMATPVATRLLGLAASLALQWLWDVRSPGLPPWYPRLRTGLTIGAVSGLLAGAALLP